MKFHTRLAILATVSFLLSPVRAESLWQIPTYMTLQTHVIGQEMLSRSDEPVLTMGSVPPSFADHASALLFLALQHVSEVAAPPWRIICYTTATQGLADDEIGY